MDKKLQATTKMKCEKVGLRLKICSYHHWQILGGTVNPIVNYWPHGKSGPKIAVGNKKGCPGRSGDAIALAGPAKKVNEETLAPWEERPKQVGVIRKAWRWLW